MKDLTMVTINLFGTGIVFVKGQTATDMEGNNAAFEMPVNDIIKLDDCFQVSMSDPDGKEENICFNKNIAIMWSDKEIPCC